MTRPNTTTSTTRSDSKDGCRVTDVHAAPGIQRPACHKAVAQSGQTRRVHLAVLQSCLHPVEVPHPLVNSLHTMNPSIHAWVPKQKNRNKQKQMVVPMWLGILYKGRWDRGNISFWLGLGKPRWFLGSIRARPSQLSDHLTDVLKCPQCPLAPPLLSFRRASGESKSKQSSHTPHQPGRWSRKTRAGSRAQL